MLKLQQIQKDNTNMENRKASKKLNIEGLISVIKIKHSRIQSTSKTHKYMFKYADKDM